MTAFYAILLRFLSFLVYFKLNSFESYVLIYSSLTLWFPLTINLYICLFKVVNLSESNQIRKHVKGIPRIHNPNTVYRLLDKLVDIKIEISNLISLFTILRVSVDLALVGHEPITCPRYEIEYVFDLVSRISYLVSRTRY